jgi:hypothetical protein
MSEPFELVYEGAARWEKRETGGVRYPDGHARLVRPVPAQAVHSDYMRVANQAIFCSASPYKTNQLDFRKCEQDQLKNYNGRLLEPRQGESAKSPRVADRLTNDSPAPAKILLHKWKKLKCSTAFETVASVLGDSVVVSLEL